MDDGFFMKALMFSRSPKVSWYDGAATEIVFEQNVLYKDVLSSATVLYNIVHTLEYAVKYDLYTPFFLDRGLQ